MLIRIAVLLLCSAVVTPVWAKGDVALGEKLYQENCVGCHRAGEDGAPGMAPLLTNRDFLVLASERYLLETIRDGRMQAGMPPWKWLGEEKLRSLVAYLRAQAPRPDRTRAVDSAPKAKGDIKRGEALFVRICATCHGVRGRGYENGNTGTHIGDPDFLRVVSDGFIREVVRHGRSGTAMRGFSGPKAIAALSDQEIDDIIVYLRSLASKRK